MGASKAVARPVATGVGMDLARSLAEAFVPTDLDNLTLWLKSDEGTNTTTDNGSISTWSDQSGNGNDATQATSAKQPVYKTGIINSKPVIRFDGTDDFLNASGAVQAQPWTFFVVGAHSVTDASVRNFIDAHETGGRNIFGKLNDTNHRLFGGQHNVTGGTLDTSFHVWTAFFNSTSSYAREDGTQILAGDGGDTSPVNGIRIGSDNLGGGQFLNGDIAEIIAYNDALTDAERSDVESYLSSKYGIALS